MEKTYTITQDQLDRVLENLSNVRSLMEYAEKDGDEEEHKQWLSEFCGIIGVLCNLGLLEEWLNYREEEIRAEIKAEIEAKEKENDND